MKTIVLFVSSADDFKRLTDVPEDALIGAISGKRVLHAFYRRFPKLLRILYQAGEFFAEGVETGLGTI